MVPPPKKMMLQKAKSRTNEKVDLWEAKERGRGIIAKLLSFAQLFFRLTLV